MTALLEALDALPDPAWCGGEVAGPIAVDGAPVDDDAWWIVHGEPAPFGDDEGTRFDPAVRDTRRLKARGATPVRFDLAPVLAEIERALVSDCRLTAELLDVLVYTKGSMFVPHQDTPRHDDQLGTLVVEIPHAHAGGTLALRDLVREVAVDWSRPARGVRWVAMFGDVLHAIAPVTDGMRLTAVYALRYRDAQRLDPADREPMDAVVDAAIALHDEAWSESFLAIPCARMIVAPRDPALPLGLAALRGSDRLVAAALARAGLEVSVHACLAVVSDEETPLVAALQDARSSRRLAMLRAPIPDALITRSDAISWDPEPATDYGYQIAAVASYVDTVEWPEVAWLVRRHARVLGKEMLFSASGYFGNEYGGYYTYRFAVLLVRVPMNAALYG